MHSSRPVVVSLFSGAGGLDIGLEDAGFHVAYCNDIDADCVATLEANQRLGLLSRAGFPYLSGALIERADVAEITGESLRSKGVTSDVDLLVGGPPCQPFSSAGRMRSFRDSRGTLYTHFVRLARELQPRYVLFENVRGLVTARDVDGKPGSALKAILRDFEQLGYRTNVQLLNLADFGGWQRRVRAFILMAREYAPPRFPEPTHQSSKRGELQLSLSGESDRRRWSTLREFLAENEDQEREEYCRPTERLAGLLMNVGDGNGLRSAGTRETTRPGGHWGYRQGTFIADPNLPARTVTAASTQDWIRLADGSLRRLTLRECARLQYFPRDWAFVGNRASRFRQIGNAVPANVGQVLGEAMMTHRRDWHERGFLSDPLSVSMPLPSSIEQSIRYTAKEEARNGDSRRTKVAKGLGNIGG